MKLTNLLRNAVFATGSLMVFSMAAFAQNQITSGTATISATVSPSVQLVSYDTTTITGNMPGTGSVSNVPTDNAINTTMNFGEVSPNNTTAAPYVYIRMGGLIRSNCAYILRAKRSGSGTLLSGAGNSGEFKAGDIGMAINNINAGGDGTNLSYPGAQTGAIAGATTTGFFKANTFPTGTTVVNSQPIWSKSLNDVDTALPTPIMEGTRVSNGGDNTVYQNRLTFNMVFAVKPQYYGVSGNSTAINPSETVTFSIVPKP